MTGTKSQYLQRGFSLSEVLIALAIFSVTISAAMIVFYGGQNFATQSVEARKAIEKSHDAVEALRIIRDANWQNLTDGKHGFQFSGGTWSLTSTPDWSDGYKRTASISTDIEGIKHIGLTVEWSHPPEGTKSIELYETLSPLEQGISGDWTHPCVLSTADGGSGSKGSDVFYDNNKAYVTSNAVSAGKEDFYIFDVSNTLSPRLLSMINVEEGLKSVTVSGNYAYVIEAGSPDFFVIDVSNPSLPVVKAKITLAGGNGRYVMVRGNYVYATTSLNANREFYVIDVSNPLSPNVVATKEFGADVNEVNILQNTAYLATASNSKELIVLDVKNPLSPVVSGSYDAPGNADGYSVHAKTKKRVYLGRTSSTDKEFLILDASNPSSISLRGSADVSGDIYSLTSVETLSFLGTAISNEEFQNYYVRDPTTPTKYGYLNFSNIATGAAYHNNVVYMSVQNNDMLQLITSQKGGVCDD